MTVLALEFPNPISWVWDKATGLLGDVVGGVVGWTFEKVIGGLVAWVLDGVSWAVGAVFGFIDTSTSPTVTAAWFRGDSTATGPYRVMLGIAAALLLVFVFAGLVQGTLAGDSAGMVRRMVLDLPIAVAGMVSTVTVTQLLIDLSDGLSDAILAGLGTDIRSFMDGIATVGNLTGGVATALAVFLLGLFTLFAALAIFVELVIRSALIYLVVGLCPLAFAALLWPATRGILKRTLELLCALILSKVVITLALAIGAAALGGAGNRTEPEPVLSPPTATPAPVDGQEPAGGSDASTVTTAAGVLLAGLATFMVACFSPHLLLRLFPAVEGAVVAQGVRGGPLRAAQTVLSTKYQLDVSRRFGSEPLPRSGPSPSAAPTGIGAGQLATGDRAAPPGPGGPAQRPPGAPTGTAPGPVPAPAAPRQGGRGDGRTG